jgi:hypothetical protein
MAYFDGTGLIGESGRKYRPMALAAMIAQWIE